MNFPETRLRYIAEEVVLVVDAQVAELVGQPADFSIVASAFFMSSTSSPRATGMRPGSNTAPAAPEDTRPKGPQDPSCGSR